MQLISSESLCGKSVALSTRTAERNKPTITKGQLSIICDSMLITFEGAKIKVEEYSQMKFEEAYPYIGCRNLNDNLSEWSLLGKSLSQPPDMRAFTEENRMLRTLKKSGNVKFLQFIFKLEDSRGRNIYDYLRIIKTKKTKSNKKFDRLFKKYDQPGI